MSRPRGPGQGPLAPDAGREVMSEAGRSRASKSSRVLRLE